jgi:ElaA protein
MLTVKIETFNNLTTQQLYQILRLRAQVFIVEQNCVYQDIDNKDQKALHVLGFKNNNLIAYTRIFKPLDYFEHASIGRVVVALEERKFGYGHVIMKHSIQAVKSYFKQSTIKISAQSYLQKFYESHGFKQVGDTYLEDGIPHIAMIKN